jgi:hypothetical protein
MRATVIEVTINGDRVIVEVAKAIKPATNTDHPSVLAVRNIPDEMERDDYVRWVDDLATACGATCKVSHIVTVEVEK